MIRSTQLQHVRALIQTVSANCESAIEFDSEDVATELLASLEYEPEIDFACLFTKNNEEFASYRREGYEGPIGQKYITFDEYYTEEGDLIVCAEMNNGSGAWLQLRANDDELQAQLNRITTIIGSVFLLCMLISTIVARILQYTVIQPVVEMAKTTRSISSSGDYSVRLTCVRDDEIGHLNNDFNEMLKQIQRREEHLENLHEELKNAHEATLAASEAKSYFLANMSHEIRTPLTGILGFSDLMLKMGDDCDDTVRQDYLKTIHSSGCHLLNLINDILDLSKIEAQQMVIEKGDCSPHHIMAEVISMLRARALKKGISLDLVWTSKVPKRIFTDSSRYRQILTNIIGNAVKFTETGGVTISAGYVVKGGQSELVVKVIDSGIGISPQNISNIFDPFVQADNSVTRRFGGTGLGLAISRKMANALDGDITVESVYGHGSTFEITISAGTPDAIQLLDAPPTDAVSVLPEASNSDSILFNQQKVLLAEDGETNRKLISLLLQRANLDVTTAENGQVAVTLAKKQNFDLILMDMQMPVMDGYRAAEKLRELGIQTPIIALTAHAMKGDDVKCRNAGCTGYLTKPVNEQRLIETVWQSLPEEVRVRCQQVSDSTIATPLSNSNENEPAISNEPIFSTLPVVHDAFREIVEEFIEFLNLQLEKIRQALGENDYQTVGELAHMLKGSGGTAGFEMLTAPARNLDDAAELHDMNRIQEALSELDGLAKRISAGSTKKTVSC
ncbi:MAG: response regulator [Planctomycetaceae bacterium]|nr:response regulator [Planctomycetaceae bacterium]